MYYQGDGVEIHCGDCIEVMAEMEENSVDAIVTDPPYALGFMGKDWDDFANTTNVAFGGQSPANIDNPVFKSRGKPISGWCEKDRKTNANYQLWTTQWATQALRVLKPGGYLLAFGGTRTSHRLVCGLEDAGFEIRDTIAWMYGQGFPKNLDIALQYEVQLCERVEVKPKVFEWHYKDTGEKMHRYSPFRHPDAEEWAGFGTALKPSVEPICVARKPLSEKNVALNCLRWGTGGIDIDGSRIEFTSNKYGDRAFSKDFSKDSAYRHKTGGENVFEDDWLRDKDKHNRIVAESLEKTQSQGRWPANVILDEEAARMLDAQSGELRTWGCPRNKHGSTGTYGMGPNIPDGPSFAGDSGGASRFFKQIKPDDCCILCELPLTPKHDIMTVGGQPCKKISVPTVVNPFKTIQATTENIALVSVKDLQIEQLAHNAKSVESLCDSCAIAIARSLVAIKQGQSQESILSQVSIADYKRNILIQNLVQFVVLWENIDIIPTIESLKFLFGSVHHAIENYTPQVKSEGKENIEFAPTRFLYCSKASRKERGKGNIHPTAKPIALMEYLVKLVSKPGAMILDPFAGSMSTVLACVAIGRKCIAIEQNEEYCEMMKDRCRQTRMEL